MYREFFFFSPFSEISHWSIHFGKWTRGGGGGGNWSCSHAVTTYVHTVTYSQDTIKDNMDIDILNS